MSVCDNEIAANLRNRLLFINRRWKDICDSVQELEHNQAMQKKREEFFATRASILDALETIDRELQHHPECTIKALKEQENRLYVSKEPLTLNRISFSLHRKFNRVSTRSTKTFKVYFN